MRRAVMYKGLAAGPPVVKASMPPSTDSRNWRLRRYHDLWASIRCSSCRELRWGTVPT